MTQMGGYDCTWQCQGDFCSDVLYGVVTEQQSNFFHEYHYLQVTYTMGNHVITAKAVKQFILPDDLLQLMSGHL